jgi:hypothetical protein
MGEVATTKAVTGETPAAEGAHVAADATAAKATHVAGAKATHVATAEAATAEASTHMTATATAMSSSSKRDGVGRNGGGSECNARGEGDSEPTQSQKHNTSPSLNWMQTRNSACSFVILEGTTSKPSGSSTRVIKHSGRAAAVCTACQLRVRLFRTLLKGAFVFHFDILQARGSSDADKTVPVHGSLPRTRPCQ